MAVLQWSGDAADAARLRLLPGPGSRRPHAVHRQPPLALARTPPPGEVSTYISTLLLMQNKKNTYF